uniref:Recep_L_domain domain-containing protein n=1 Tax=Angiostrongylus cantonensis TaxID=6313 RepID=A0A0K0D3W1_ANGCA
MHDIMKSKPRSIGNGHPRVEFHAFNQCSAPKPLTSLDDVVGCESVFGDIVLRGSTLLPPNKPLKPFNHIGCVVVKNSTVENIDFLSNMKAHMNPPWFCKNEKVCMGGIVIPDYISSTIAGYQCAIIKGDVIIENWKGNTRALQHLKSIRKIIGVLRVLNNLDLVNLDFLAGLQEIDAGTTEQRKQYTV